MANYGCAIRTNYFRVKDEEQFAQLMNTVVADDVINVFSKTNKQGQKYFGFGCYGLIQGMPLEDDDDDIGECYDEFIERLQECVAEDDAIIILESGNEKLRYVTGLATVITNKKVRCLDLTYMAIDAASTMLGNDSYTTVCEY